MGYENDEFRRKRGMPDLPRRYWATPLTHEEQLCGASENERQRWLREFTERRAVAARFLEAMPRRAAFAGASVRW